MRTLTITAAEWASVTDGTLWLVREGERCDLDDFIKAEVPSVALCGPHPPDEFVQVCAPCETCGDQRIATSGGPGYFKGGRLHHLAGGQTVMEIRCPDCCIELVGPCPYERDHTWLTDCVNCSNSGTITLGHAYAVGEPLLLHDWPGMGISPGMLKALAHYGPSESLVGKWAIELRVVGS